MKRPAPWRASSTTSTRDRMQSAPRAGYWLSPVGPSRTAAGANRPLDNLRESASQDPRHDHQDNRNEQGVRAQGGVTTAVPGDDLVKYRDTPPRDPSAAQSLTNVCQRSFDSGAGFGRFLRFRQSRVHPAPDSCRRPAQRQQPSFPPHPLLPFPLLFLGRSSFSPCQHRLITRNSAAEQLALWGGISKPGSYIHSGVRTLQGSGPRINFE